MPYEKRINPEGHPGSRIITEEPQVMQQTSDVRILIRPDQMNEEQGTGKMVTTPGPRAYGGAE